MDQREWTFITASRPAQFRGKRAKLVVKSIAGRHHWLNHGVGSAASMSSATALRISNGRDSDNAQENALRLQRRPPAATSASSVPDWIVGAHVWRTDNMMAAFNLPQQSHKYYSDVMNHYLTVIVPRWRRADESGPSPFVDSQIKASMECPLLLEALISFSSAQQDLLYGRQPSKKTMRHKQEAIRQINSKLSSGLVEDSTIFAVAQLGMAVATMASDTRAPEYVTELEIHMDGIEAMVAHRGGIYMLGYSGILNRIICWQDQITAELTGKPARFAPPIGTDGAPDIDVPKYALDFTSPMPWSILILAPQSKERHMLILDVASQLFSLTKLEAMLDKATMEEKSSYAELLSSMEEEMSVYITNAIEQASLDRDDLVREAFCTSSSIYAQIQLRQAVPGSAVLEMLKLRQIHIFTHLDIAIIAPDRLKAEAPFMLWMLCCGAILCINDAERMFFVSRIISLIRQLQIRNWEKINRILMGYLWTDKLDDWNLQHGVEDGCLWK